MRPEDLLVPRPEGLFSPLGGFFIDPTRPVAKALISHAHSDHARPGHGAVLATRETLDLMRVRLGEDFAGQTQAVAYGEAITIGDTRVSFHPAGHVLGSAQIAVAGGGLRIVVSGDYKDVPDPTCAPFAPLPCDVFISEATFGLPVFIHPAPAAEIGRLLQSLAVFPERAHLVGAYSLGKAQHVLALLRLAGYDRPIYLHGALERVTAYYAARGIALGPVLPACEAAREDLAGAVVIAPPSALNEPWGRRLPEPLTALASGWMRVWARARQRGAMLPLVISDHADWNGLRETIRATGAGEVWLTHGEEDALVHWCGTQGLVARPLRMVGHGEDEAERLA